jgi:hypothetical protein
MDHLSLLPPQITERSDKAIHVSLILKRDAESDPAPQNAHGAKIARSDALSVEPPLHFGELIGNR